MLCNCCSACSNLAKALLFLLFFVAITLCSSSCANNIGSDVRNAYKMLSSSEVEMSVIK